MGLLGGLLWVFEEVHRQAVEAQDEPKALREALHALYERHASGELSEEDFCAQEEVLADRLATLEAGQ